MRKQKPKDDLGRVIDLDALATKYAVEAETFEVILPDGDTLTFKPIRRPSELKAIYASAAILYAALPKPGTEAERAHPWSGFIPHTEDEFFSAFKISELSVEPKIPYLVAFKLLRNAFIIELIETAIDANSKTMSSMRFLQRVEDAKKNLTEALSIASESDVPPSASGDTPTS